MKKLIDRFDIERVSKLMDAGDYVECRDSVHQLSCSVGHTSSWLLYVKGICEDNLGNPFNGIIDFKKALQLDPYNYGYLSALTTNTNIFKNKLIAAIDDNEVSLQEIQKIHRVLKEAGELSSSNQYLLAKNYLVRQYYQAASDLISCFLNNNPSDMEALILEKVIHEHGKLLAS